MEIYTRYKNYERELITEIKKKLIKEGTKHKQIKQEK